MTPETAVKGLAVLTVIPVVLLALWADYFAKYLEEVQSPEMEEGEFNRSVELTRIRLAGFLTLIFQFLLFVGTSDVRQIYPVFTSIFSLAAIMVQLVMQVRLEGKLKPETKRETQKAAIRELNAKTATHSKEPGTATATFESATRAFFWCAFGGALYVGVTLVSARGFFWAAEFFPISPAARTLIMIVGGILGMLGGLALNFALAPFLIRKILGATALEDGETREKIKASFEKAKLQVPGFWVIGSENFGTAAALISGFRFGKGVFHPGLLLTRATLNSLNTDELQAVVLHEISHVKLHHLTKRLLMTGALIVAITSAAGTLVALGHVFHFSEAASTFLGPGAALISFLATFKILTLQTRYQEVQADLYCIEKLGARLDALCSALKKIHEQRNTPEMGSTHAPTERRIEFLQKHFSAASVTPISASEKASDEQNKAA